MQSSSFSWVWVAIAFVIFIATEILIGGLIGGVVTGSFITESTRYRIEVLLLLASFLVGGFLIGVITPRVRLFEPAVAAFLSIVVTFLYALFVPLRWYEFLGGRVFAGGFIAFLIALGGAYAGEKLTGSID